MSALDQICTAHQEALERLKAAIKEHDRAIKEHAAASTRFDATADALAKARADYRETNRELEAELGIHTGDTSS